MWVEFLSYDYILRYCRLYQPGSIVIHEILKTVLASCGKMNGFLTHLSVQVTENNLYIISWVGLMSKALSRA